MDNYLILAGLFFIAVPDVISVYMDDYEPCSYDSYMRLIGLGLIALVAAINILTPWML